VKVYFQQKKLGSSHLMEMHLKYECRREVVATRRHRLNRKAA
jgi:hypothetical protein